MVLSPNGGDNPCVCGYIHPCCRFLVDGGCPHATPGDHHHAPNQIEAFLAGNRFKAADNVTELIYQLVGAGSTCWVGGTGAAEFDSSQAVQVAEDGIDRLIELGWA